MKAFAIALLFIQSLVLVPVLSAQGQVVFGSYKYTVGDNETKVDAKRSCFSEAKRRCIEKVGTYLESVTTVRNFQLETDDISAYAAAFLKVEVVSEKIQLEGESPVIDMVVKAVVDTLNIRQQIEQSRKENKLKAEKGAHNSEIHQLTRKIDSLQVHASKISDNKNKAKFALDDSLGNKSPPARQKDVTVYVTRTGAKYHRSGCRYLRRSMIAISLGEAKRRFSPCSVCLPPN